ncbi:MAG TPA: lipocalin family protein [Gemmatimonadales bacterium]|nr:lipocalin family protein [Gemmatimonadales bacterium]
MVGVWQLSKCEYVSTQGLGTVDLIAGGGTGTVEFTADDSIKVSVTPATGSGVSFTGTYQISGLDLMKVTPAGVTWYWAFDMRLSGQTLQLTNGSAQYDFNQDGTPDPASWNLYMHR